MIVNREKYDIIFLYGNKHVCRGHALIVGAVPQLWKIPRQAFFRDLCFSSNSVVVLSFEIPLFHPVMIVKIDRGIRITVREKCEKRKLKCQTSDSSQSDKLQSHRNSFHGIFQGLVAEYAFVAMPRSRQKRHSATDPFSQS